MTLIEQYFKAQADVKLAKKKEAELHKLIIEAYKEEMNEPFGTFDFGDIKISVSKNVSYDQEIMADLYEEMPEAITVKYGVNENEFKNFGDNIKAKIMQARMVKPAKATIKRKDSK